MVLSLEKRMYTVLEKTQRNPFGHLKVGLGSRPPVQSIDWCGEAGRRTASSSPPTPSSPSPNPPTLPGTFSCLYNCKAPLPPNKQTSKINLRTSKDEACVTTRLAGAWIEVSRTCALLILKNSSAHGRDRKRLAGGGIAQRPAAIDREAGGGGRRRPGGGGRWW